MTKVLGVDAGGGQWLAIALLDGLYAGAVVRPTVTDVLVDHPDARVIAVDIPIGLPRGGPRPADAEARRFVGGARASSVFSSLPAEVLCAPDYTTASAIARATLGKSLSAQSYALRHRIFEVEAVAAVDPRVIEVHPEVSFRALAGAPLRYSKHTWSGIAERRSLLASVGILLPDDLPGGGLVAPDDVVDAAVAAWSALRAAEGRSATLPAVPSTDAADGGVIHF